ncbi:MAG TPA: hypothetical protein DIC34_12965 [Treponema sp.]|nr:MAG: hypothetical protein A2Y36_04255 [Treponema sp. GWA1_62_8]OHE63158.1 MAG: hypothetical protein A2001_16510 [Treponema sp. GWC1_61_84]OHE76598.1 MAG: hypothetical protein A2413_18560 [Treponema sp. RIFOXYC1_FULL_61_9]HCM27434.1 hypothetical protein [Treponema sp.]
MKKFSDLRLRTLITAVLGASAIFAGCSSPTNSDPDPVSVSPTVLSTLAADSATGVAVNSTVSATFSKEMAPASIVAANFTILAGTVPVLGNVSYDAPNKRAVFAPSANFANSTLYTATITLGALDLTGNALSEQKVWTFTTASAGMGPAPVSLGTAGNYAILAKTAISTVPSSAITGDIGLSPAAESYMTGFSQTDATGYATSPQVTGFMYAADMTPPTPTYMTTAISDMELAYTDAAGRVTPDFLNLASGAIGGLTLAPGLYNWTSSVTIPTNVAISGGANDVWIFQITGDLSASSVVIVTLSGGAQAKNIFWQVAGSVALGTGAHFEGIILSQTAVSLNTGATMNGRILAQTQVALDQATVTQPTL